MHRGTVMLRQISILALVSCAADSGVPPARFANTSIVTAVNDRRDVAKPPAKRRPIGRGDISATSDGRTCASHVVTAPPTNNDGYSIIRITTERGSFGGETFVHLGRDPATGVARVIGLWRS
jgi:hypothetical protein